LLPLAAGSVLPYIERLLYIKLNQQALTSSIHCSPRDAVEIHQTMRSEPSVGISWGTLTTASHAQGTVSDLETACREAKMGFTTDRLDGAFAVVDIEPIWGI